MKTAFASIPARSAILLAAMAAASTIPAHATDLYWGGWTNGTAAWSTATNWYTDAGESIVSGAAPTAADDLFFNTTTDNALGGTITLSGAIAADSLTYNTTAATTISNVSGEKTLSLGAGGITMNSGAGALTLGITSGALWTETTANQTWTNNSSNALIVRRVRASNSATGPVQLTLNAAGTGAITFSNSMGDSLDGTKALSLVIDSTGTGLVNLTGPASSPNNQAMSGGTTIRRGTVATSATSVGSGSVTFDATTGNTATLRLGSTAAYANNIVANASGGTQILEFTGTSGALNGDVLLNGSLNVGARLTGATGVTINGDISGNGDLIKGQYQGGNSGLLTLAGANTHSGDTTISNGALTLADTGSLTFYIGANGVSNQVNGASTGAVTFNGAFNFNLSGASLVDGNSWTLVDVSNETYGSSFSITSFTDGDADNVWTNGTGLSFAEATGILSFSAVPEPSTYALLAGAAGLLITGVRRVRNRRA